MNRDLYWCSNPKGSIPIACSKRKKAYLLVPLAHFHVIFNTAKNEVKKDNCQRKHLALGVEYQ